MGKKVSFIVGESSVKWNRCVIVFGTTEMGNVDVTVAARLKDSICALKEKGLEQVREAQSIWENRKVQAIIIIFWELYLQQSNKC